uniref:Proteasome activator subunit 4 n=1 Tax=Timema cristinae TaxID=61476 RepID=A0A7R9CE00_TIMCR|nr:unnamed protein product [Timema cristinae]
MGQSLLVPLAELQTMTSLPMAVKGNTISLDPQPEQLIPQVSKFIFSNYFPEAATQEMLDLWRPMLCPFNSNTMLATMETLECFLPLSLPPEKAHLGYQLWFHEFMDLWGACHNAPIWEGEMMWLMARLANRNIGYIDWEPYIPLMFTRFLRSLSLPVVYKQTHATKHHKLNSGAMAKWIVAVLGGGSSAQKYLNKFMKTLESYFHPANFGHWLLKLKDFLRKLPYCFVLRVNFERYKKTWETQVPDSHKLTEDDITSFVESVQPVAMQAMFSKLGATDVIHALQHLATLRPSLIIPQVIERMYANLETLTEPHKLTAAMQCVVAVARPMVQGKTNGYKEGPTHVIPLLLATLPGIDPNDIRKCFVTLQFISTFATMIPFVDSSTASEHWKDLTEEEEIICLATADFEDFVLQFMDRCFILIENSSLEATRLEQEEDKRSKIENMAECALSSSCTALLVQTSPEIFKLLDCPGTALLAHLPVISKVLNRTLHLTCREGYRLATCLLRNLLSGLSSIVPLDYRSLPHPLDKPVKEYLPIRDWAKPGNINNLGLLWYVPGKEELACVQDIVSTYLPEELSTINKYINGDMTLTREELKRSLLIIWESLMLEKSGSTNNFEARWKNFRTVKKVLENKVIGGKKHLRSLLVDRVVLQHEALYERSTVCLTETHRQIMLNLLTLSTSHYSEVPFYHNVCPSLRPSYNIAAKDLVRVRAQAKLFLTLDQFAYSYMILIPQLLSNLQQDSNQFHEQFKGSLYVLLGPKQSPVLARHDWSILSKLWPCIVRTQPSEKLSVIRLMEGVMESVHKFFPTITINMKVAIRCLVFVLKQQKRSHKKVVVNTNSFFGDVGEPIGGMKPGPRPDNQWVQYSSENRPLSAEEWDKPRYLHKPYHGFYTWPKEVKIYAPSSEQPSLPRSIEDMNAVEQEVAQFFSHQGNVHKLVGFLSLEEKKGKDKFNDYRFMMFKGLFRNFGDYHISYFLPHLERLVLDKHESSQRCAAEILAGIIRGAKHWPFEMVVKMWDKLCPILKTAMANMTEETIADWGICFATASECRDPNRHHWLLELLIEDPLRDEASFIAAGRLYALQGALNQQEWRVSELFNRLLNYLKPYLTHEFQNVRDRLGRYPKMNSIVLRLLEDDWLEVREKAAQVLGGLIHCDFLIEPENALETFKEKAKTKLKKKIKNNVVDSTGIELLKVRHAGILGLCAFINAYPYDVPEFMPEFFFILGQHLNDPQPIPSTIRKTLGDFKRTHHDNWEHHSLKFTEEQLAVLTDLTIPPSYYA